jgi:DNA-binding HxlR family transcriptional regulator
MTVGKRLQGKIKPYAVMLEGIAHTVRLQIAYSLAQGDMETWEIVNAVKLHPALVSHHLKLLHKSGWVKRVRVGKRVTYSLIPNNLKEIERLFRGTAFYIDHFTGVTK